MINSVVLPAARGIYRRLLNLPGLPPTIEKKLRSQAARFRKATPPEELIVAVNVDEPIAAANTGGNPWNTDKPFDISGMWFSATACQETINLSISGNENKSPVEYMVEKYLAASPESHLLVVGSNEGNMTASLRQYGYRGAITETDIADKAMERAAARYQELGIGSVTQVLADLNSTSIPGSFDFIVAEGVLHHIEQIEFCLNNLFDCLRPGGLLIAIEYIGPVRFQLSDLNVHWINAALNAMPRRLRPFDAKVRPEFPPSAEDAAKVYYVVASEESIRQFDPSEACIGEVLDDLLCHKFSVVERKGFGGTLLSYMTGHFDFERSNQDTFTREWLKCLIALEQTVIRSGILKDHFCFYVLKKDG